MDRSSEEEELLRLAANHRSPVRAPQSIADLLSRLMARKGYANLQAAEEWTDIWKQAAGSQAADSRVGKCSRGVLEISVRNSATLQELTFRKKRLLQAVQQLAPQFKVKDLRFRIGSMD